MQERAKHLAQGLVSFNSPLKQLKSSQKSSFCSKKKTKKALSKFNFEQERASLVTPFYQTSPKEVRAPLARKVNHSKSKSITCHPKELSEFSLQYRQSPKLQLGEPNRFSFFITPNPSLKNKGLKSPSPKPRIEGFNITQNTSAFSKQLHSPKPSNLFRTSISKAKNNPSGKSQNQKSKKTKKPSHGTTMIEQETRSPLSTFHSRTGTKASIDPKLTRLSSPIGGTAAHSRQLSSWQQSILLNSCGFSSHQHDQDFLTNNHNSPFEQGNTGNSSKIVSDHRPVVDDRKAENRIRTAQSPKIINRGQLEQLHKMFQKKKKESTKSGDQCRGSQVLVRFNDTPRDRSPTKYKMGDSQKGQSTKDANHSQSDDRPRDGLRFRFEDRDRIDPIESTDRCLEPQVPITKYTEASRRDYSPREDESPNDSVTKYLQACKFDFYD